MFCKKCGASLTEADQFCMNCGEKVVNESSNDIGFNSGSSMDNNSNSNNYDEPIISMTPIEVNNVENKHDEPIMMSSSDSNIMNDNTSNDNGMNNNMNSGINNDMGNGMNNSFNTNTNNNSNNGPVNNSNNNIGDKIAKNKNIIIIAGAVVLLIIVFIIGFMSGHSSEGGTGSTGGSGEGGDATPVSAPATYKLTFGNFVLDFPYTIVNEISNNVLYMTDENSSYLAQLVAFQGYFDNLDARIPQLKKSFENDGFTVKSAQKKNIGGIELVTLDVTAQGKNVVYAYAKAPQGYVFCLCVFDQENSFNYDVVEEIAPILKSAKYSTDSMGMQAKDKTDVKTGVNLFKK